MPGKQFLKFEWFLLLIFYFRKMIKDKVLEDYSAVVAWSVKRLLHKKCHLLAVDQILLGLLI